MKPIFYASEVASLLGKNRFKPREESIVRVLGTTAKWGHLVKTIQKDMGALSRKDIVQMASPAITESIERAIEVAVASGTDADIQKTIDTFQTNTAKTLLNDAIEGKPMSRDFSEAAQRIKAQTSTIQEEIAALKTAPVVATLTQEIQTQRGVRLEAKAEDVFGAQTGRVVNQRNTPVRYECEEYCIVGYIDGMQDGTLVETKNRKRFWTSPPEYDIIQLRCYMKMKGCENGLLLETFPGKPHRKTPVPHSESEWNDIHTGLCEVAAEIDSLTHESASMLIRTVLSKMDRE
jgi:hypothetical protein